jgi:hypothetical protein
MESASEWEVLTLGEIAGVPSGLSLSSPPTIIRQRNRYQNDGLLLSREKN